MERIKQLFTVPELRNKVLTVLGLLVVYRVLAAIPIPGIDPLRLETFFGSSQLFGFLNVFSGGGLSNLSLVMLGVGPYITSTIIMQLMTVIFPSLKQAYFEEGERGRAKFNRYSRWLTVPLALLQGYSFLALLISQNVIDRPDTINLVANVLAIAAGSFIAMWLGELITEKKIGNGVSLIIFAGIVSGLPSQVLLGWQTYSVTLVIAFALITLLVIYGIVYLTEGERRVPITYARQVRGNKLYGGSSSYLPLKVNQAGMIPLIFAISVLLFPQFIAQVVTLINQQWGLTINEWVLAFMNNNLYYGIAYFFLVVAFTYFYTTITFDPAEIAKNLQRQGGFIPGIRPGENTVAAFSKMLARITLFGAVALGLVAVLPLIVQAAVGYFSGTVLTQSSALTLSGTAIIIVVAVALETTRQISSQLGLRDYDR